MTRPVYRDEHGRFTTREKAFAVQKVDGDEWQKPVLLELFEDIEEQYEEFEYFVGFNYQTPTIKSGQETLTQHGKHDFKTEFRVTSPDKLSDHDIKQAIISEFSSGEENYSHVLKNNAYNIKSPTHSVTNERPRLIVKRTAKVER